MHDLTIAICDDHALVRSGIARVLEQEPGFRIIASAATAEEARTVVGQTQPDVLLLDVTMPGRSGIDVLPELRLLSPQTKVLMLSMHDDPAYVRQSLAAGARGYVLKDAADAELVKAIRQVAEGHRYVDPVLGARLASATPAPAARVDLLSEREHDVLRLLALGHTNQEIAQQLFISVRTAETHRAHIMRKLQLSTRAELVRYAIEHGHL
jgi:two-component system response regulator NreC